MLLNPTNIIDKNNSNSSLGVSKSQHISCSAAASSAPRSFPYAASNELKLSMDRGHEINGTTIDNIDKSSSFYKLIMDLKQLLAGKGLSSEDIDVEKVTELMENYKSSDDDWSHLALHDETRNYSRNGVINLNGNANLLILVWSPGKSSAIHDHANAHCCMKILKGELRESLYDIPEQTGQELKCKKETPLYRDQVGYISDKIGLHKITNPLKDEFSVSLHLYTPPYAALYGCSMYEASNGRKHHVDMSKYYSWQGELVNDTQHSTC
ncbi:hypothetical protein KGF57_000434 [Candida theae]|uniref:Cysteine dioxygenase n=1 Tax=Candida theae TaxID=1198502 RepID=A0AAD5BJF1_9ASCO|nr:uncharacterized protein KGF57_000434 [Candida theae]KAI5967219.1 hypothetical protein KGF57_000434 [Candida theae]